LLSNRFLHLGVDHLSHSKGVAYIRGLALAWLVTVSVVGPCPGKLLVCSQK
jgi:hypothetical protein